MICRICENKCDAIDIVFDRICRLCYRDPETNDCAECGKHLSGIPYEYVCGFCVRKKDEQNRKEAD